MPQAGLSRSAFNRREEPNDFQDMLAAIWTGEDIALVTLCTGLGVVAVGFFITIFVADFRERRRKTEARRALRRKARPLN